MRHGAYIGITDLMFIMGNETWGLQRYNRPDVYHGECDWGLQDIWRSCMVITYLTFIMRNETWGLAKHNLFIKGNKWITCLPREDVFHAFFYTAEILLSGYIIQMRIPVIFVMQYMTDLSLIVSKGSGSCLNQISGFEHKNDTKSIVSIIGPQNVGPLEPLSDPDM